MNSVSCVTIETARNGDFSTFPSLTKSTLLEAKMAKSTIPQERFWTLVNKNGPIHPTLQTRCWLWCGEVIHRGYGRFWTPQGKIRAHRYSFFLEHGRWPEPMCLHSCDNRLCVNPAHLREGTGKDNAADRGSRGRHAYGEKQGLAKLNASDVQRVRKLLSTMTGRSIAKQFGVSASTISNIKKGKVWAWLK